MARDHLHARRARGLQGHQGHFRRQTFARVKAEIVFPTAGAEDRRGRTPRAQLCLRGRHPARETSRRHENGSAAPEPFRRPRRKRGQNQKNREMQPGPRGLPLQRETAAQRAHHDKGDRERGSLPPGTPAEPPGQRSKAEEEVCRRTGNRLVLRPPLHAITEKPKRGAAIVRILAHSFVDLLDPLLQGRVDGERRGREVKRGIPQRPR